MDEKDKVLPDEEKQKDIDALIEEDEIVDEIVEEEGEDWEFDANAPTLDTNVIEGNGFEIELDNIEIEPEEAKPILSNTKKDSSKVTISTKTIRIIALSLISVVLVAVLVFFGVRYYTVPNGKEGKAMNPGNVALTVGKTDVSIGMYNYYYSRVVNNYISYASYGYYELDTSKDFSKQFTEDDDGNKVSWLEFFKIKTIDQIQYVTSYYEAGVEAGVTLTNEQKETIKSQIEQLQTSASEAEKSVDAYIAGEFGEYCSQETLEVMLEQALIAESYYRQRTIETQITDKEFEKFFKENKNDYSECKFAFLEMAYDTTSDDTKADSVNKAKAYLKKISTVDDMKKLVPEVCEDMIKQYIEYGYFEDEKDAIKQLSDYLENSMTASDDTYGEGTVQWLFSEDTKVGDTHYYVDEENAVILILLKTGEPTFNEDTVYSVRHILVAPGTESEEESTEDTEEKKTYTDAEWAAAKKEAEAILADYKKGDKTEYAFALLAEEKSEDTESTSSGQSGLYGGLYEGTTKGQMVAEFEEWSLDSSRKYGDTGIVKTEYGYHIMYFIDTMAQYKFNCITNIKAEKEKEFVDSYKVKERRGLEKTEKAKPVETTAAE